MATITPRTWIYKGEERTAFRASFRDRSGKRRHKQFKTEVEARKFIKRLEREGERSIDPKSPSPISVAEMAERWLKACEKGLGEHQPVELSTLKQYQGHVENHIKPRLGDLRLTDLTRARCKRFRDDLLGDLSRPLAKKVMQSLQAILEEAVDQEVVATNPAWKVQVRISTREKKRVTIPSKEEMQNLLATANALVQSNHLQIAAAWRRYRILIMTAVFTGLRASELRGLRWPRVYFDRAVVEVAERVDAWNQFGPCKSRSGYREIEIPADLVEMLRDWQLVCPASSHKLVFPNGVGNVESIQNIHNRCWHPLQVRAGVMDENGKPKYIFHAIRHFFASALIDKGATPKEVQMLMGHSDIKMTMDTYGHLFPEGRAGRKLRADRLASEMLSKTAASTSREIKSSFSQIFDTGIYM